MLHVEPWTNGFEQGQSNSYKQGTGPSSSLRANFDYNSGLVRRSSLGHYTSGSNSVPISSNLKGEPTETNLDKHALLDTTTTTTQISPLPNHSVMQRNGRKPKLNLVDIPLPEHAPVSPTLPQPLPPPLNWDWDIEHEDRRLERKADAAYHHEIPFEVDRRLLKDVVREKMGSEVGRIKFLSSGTFHKAYLITLTNHEELVARVARRFMPRLKTESEVATLSYLREKTNVPVPKIYHYDSNPYNRLGGEFILMSKASGIPLSQVFHGLAYNDLVKLVKNLARIILPLFAHRFSDIGSLYFGPDPRTHVPSGSPTPKATQQLYSGFPFSPTLGMMSKSPSLQSICTITHDYHVGPIISWPFFGSNRGELVHPTEMNRGPWPSTSSYLDSCVDREIKGVIRENEGSAAPHRLHLDPDEIRSSRHHRLRAVPGDESDDSDEYDLEESDEEWEGPGNINYRDYRRMQRSTFLVAHLNQREQAVRREMERWKRLMAKLVKQIETSTVTEDFALDCHDLSLENVFVDPKDNTKITCIIDWESTTTRPLWASAHLPACVQSSAFVSKLFRKAVAELPSDPEFGIHLPKNGRTIDPTQLCREWLYYEATGTRLRMAHRCAEWDGWEEGLVDSILGPEEFESEWMKVPATPYDHKDLKAMVDAPHRHGRPNNHGRRPSETAASFSSLNSQMSALRESFGGPMVASPKMTNVGKVKGGVGAMQMPTLPFVVEEKKREQMLKQTGDICGGRGGELGRRLEAWLTVSGKGMDGEGEETMEQWNGEDKEHPGVNGNGNANGAWNGTGATTNGVSQLASPTLFER
ncbi:protein kinase subdomain-containing protein PKL/CAK/Fmp29 [Coprinopsis marcescibilis]|uniref:Protein kinase subdomain-containing protein PKL/CAK/Fmp29 n=1 Tax=Coprinopsis marcescibilis TaxID=230819 RepID=A0A5C3KXG2_COPMA|nr:protein kinase subdomain-containing protein PKL/CAK/Fmp29 [Coprinopsis marcescibilis]